MLHGVTLLHNGVDVRERFSEEFLRSINSTRAASVRYRKAYERRYYQVALIRSLLTCRNRTVQQRLVLPSDVASEKSLLDLAMRLTAPDPRDRISVEQAKGHAVFEELLLPS
jgi:hypothetical protein